MRNAWQCWKKASQVAAIEVVQIRQRFIPGDGERGTGPRPGAAGWDHPRLAQAAAVRSHAGACE